jgi:uncharacterized protein (DUF2384 family)
MITVIPPATSNGETEKPRSTTRRFRAASAVRATPEVVTRQATAASLVFTLLDADAARAFLNTSHAGLNGRPIDVAGASDDGLLRVKNVIATMARG